MNVTYEALLKGLIKQMIQDECDEYYRLLLSRLDSKEIQIADLTEEQKSVFRKLARKSKLNIISYLQKEEVVHEKFFKG